MTVYGFLGFIESPAHVSIAILDKLRKAFWNEVKNIRAILDWVSLKKKSALAEHARHVKENYILKC